ncbi:MAG: hypothetical protein ACHREM_12565 [Polyangiales bacterium]
MSSSRSFVVVAIAIVVGCRRRESPSPSQTIVAVPSAEAPSRARPALRIALGEEDECRRAGNRLVVRSAESVLLVDAQAERRFRAPGLGSKGYWGVFDDRLIYGAPSYGEDEPVPYRAVSLVSGAAVPVTKHASTNDGKTALANQSGTPVWRDEPRWVPSLPGAPVPPRFLRVDGDASERRLLALDPLAFESFDESIVDGDEIFTVAAARWSDTAILAAKEGGAVRTLASAPQAENSEGWVRLGLSTHDVWYTTGGELWRVPRGGGAPTRVIAAKPRRHVSALLVEGDNVHVARGASIVDAAAPRTPLVDDDDDIREFTRLDSGKWAWCTATELVAQR